MYSIITPALRTLFTFFLLTAAGSAQAQTKGVSQNVYFELFGVTPTLSINYDATFNQRWGVSVGGTVHDEEFFRDEDCKYPGALFLGTETCDGLDAALLFPSVYRDMPLLWIPAGGDVRGGLFLAQERAYPHRLVGRVAEDVPGKRGEGFL